MSKLSQLEIDKCMLNKEEICGSNTMWWIIIAVLVLIIVVGSGYLGYKYYTDDICFRTGKPNCDARKKAA
jgi:hypothetical protein